ncbi:MAG TPA: zinc ABC transporter substrate-binding protein [Sulfuricurvum sp.]|nr:zinc ABC transporter substrate-binding protein [Sulfuricurvum sp.]
MCNNCPKQKKVLTILVGSFVAFIGFSILFAPAKKSERVKSTVCVSTFSLYEIAHTLAGDTFEVKPIIPLGSDAHAYSPSPSDVASISKAALFVYSGAGFESWAQSLKSTLPSTVTIIDMSQHVELLKEDPHYWLNIDNMISMTETMEAELSRISPKNKELYRTNALAYIAELKKLKSEYVAGLAQCKLRTLVTNHDAFGYLAHANNLKNISIIGLSSDEQPSAKTMANIITLVQKEKIETIFFEELIDDNVAQTIAKESGATAKPLQPLENISETELKSHSTYLSIMRDNLTKIREAMECR